MAEADAAEPDVAFASGVAANIIEDAVRAAGCVVDEQSSPSVAAVISRIESLRMPSPPRQTALASPPWWQGPIGCLKVAVMRAACLPID